MSEHSDALDYVLSIAQTGTPVGDLQHALDALLTTDRTEVELADWRLRRGRLKKVCDEILPVTRLVRFLGESNGHVRFPLDSKAPDCYWRRAQEGSPIGVEVTISQGRARHILGTELVTAPRGSAVRGFLSLQDDAGKRMTEAAKRSSRAMYSTPQALASTGDGIRRCLREKDHEKYRGMILLIEAPLETLPAQRWQALQPALREEAQRLPFQSVFVLGNGERLPGLQLK